MSPPPAPVQSAAFLQRVLRGDAAWPPGIGAEAVAAQASLHGVLPLVFERAHRSDAWGGWPQSLRETLQDAARAHAAGALARRAELARVLETLAAVGVEPLVLKGMALAHTLYPEPWLRPCADADLLVDGAQRGRLFAALAEQGYQRTGAAGGDLASAEASFSNGSPLVLDIHWRINNSPLLAGVLGYHGLMERSVPIAALGPRARAPGIVDAVLLAAIHRAAHFQSPYYAGGEPHRGDRLIWLYDLHLLAPALTPAQSAEVAQRAAAHRVAGLCLEALLAAHAAFGTPLPRLLTDGLARAAATREPSMVFLRGGRRRLLLAELRAVRGWVERARWLREHAVPPAAYMLRKYDTRRRWLLPALYVRRALGWLAR